MNNNGYRIEPWEYGKGNIMTLTGPWKSDYKNVIISKDVSALRLSLSAGWTDNNISFVQELGQIKGLGIYSWNVQDISPVQDLAQLEMLGLQCDFRKPIDFSAFDKLLDCYIYWKPKCDSLFFCESLKHLNIECYPYSDFSNLGKLKHLETLNVTSRKLECMQGIELLNKIRVLDLYMCTKLLSLKGIEALSCLKTLEVVTCKKITDLTSVGSLNALTRFMFSNCGEVISLLPLIYCKNLEELFFIESTNVMDGNLTFFKKLPKLKKMRFANRKHYSHTREEIQHEIENR